MKNKEQVSTIHITFLKTVDGNIFENKKDRTTFKSVTYLYSGSYGSIMGIEFHADVNMIYSQTTIVNALTKA